MSKLQRAGRDATGANPTAAPDRFSVMDRIAIVTGAGSGLGQAIACGLVEAGATVVAADLPGADFSALEAMNSDRVLVVDVDVTDLSLVEQMTAQAIGRYGRIDILVNSAGIGGRGKAEEYGPDLLQRVMAVNFTGTFNCCQVVGRTMLDRGGSIINVASVGGLVGYPGSVGYQASKGAVVQLTRSLAIEWARRRVRVNAIAPSQFETPIVRRQWELEPATRDFFVERTPIGRLGNPDEVVGPVIFLASDASAMVHGHILLVDGGYVAQ